VSAPTPKQLAYFDALVKRVMDAESADKHAVYESLGLIESSPWGGRIRSEAITRANVSRHIDTLKGRL
jgi:hypothetical protein